MIAPLRRRHRALSIVLWLALPALYVAALIARPQDPGPRPLPAALVEAPLAAVVHEERAAYGDFSVTTRVGRLADGRWAVELAPEAPIPRPEVLVYWSRAAPRDDELAAGGELLGELAGRRPRTFALPPAAAGGPGRLTLYSLGHRQVLGTSELPAAEEGR